MVQISCYDTAGSVLLLGCVNGCIYYYDMQKFPLRIKDNDLLITELFRDLNVDTITVRFNPLLPTCIRKSLGDKCLFDAEDQHLWELD